MPHIFSRPLFSRKRSGITEEIIHGAYLFVEEGVGTHGDNFPVVASTLFTMLQLAALEIDCAETDVLAAVTARRGKSATYFSVVKKMADSMGVEESELVCERSPGRDAAGVSRMSRFYNPYALLHVFMVGVCKRDGDGCRQSEGDSDDRCGHGVG